jgi:hypothetical protein
MVGATGFEPVTPGYFSLFFVSYRFTNTDLTRVLIACGFIWFYKVLKILIQT